MIPTRAALLAALMHGPGCGVDLVACVVRMTGGAIRPSDGSVYPTLAELEAGGLIVRSRRGGRAIYWSITIKGRKLAAQHRAAITGLFGHSAAH